MKIIYFPHIPKAGGTTLKQQFFKAFGNHDCLKIWDPRFGADVSPEGFKDVDKKTLQGIKAITGHLPVNLFFENQYAKAAFESGDIKIITAVRNPIDRVISLYNYVSHNRKHPNHLVMKNKSPIEFITEQKLNFQYNFLKFPNSDGLDAIFESITVFSIENSIAEFANFFQQELNFDVGRTEIKNTTVSIAGGRKLFSMNDIPVEVLKQLEEKHYLDMSLYRHAKSAANKHS